MRLLIGTILVMLTCGVALADEPVALKPGAASDTTTAVCSACHTSDYIVMNSRFLTPQAWKAEVTKMRSVYGAPIDDDTAAAVTAYLGDTYGVAANK